MSKQTKEQLLCLRKSIAEVDEKIVGALAERMSISPEIASWKIRNRKSIVQEETEKKCVARMLRLGRKCGLSAEFVRAVSYLIIAESCRIQIQIKDSQSKPLFLRRKNNIHRDP